jgi:Ca2+-binding EF-hand superfamily protein
MLPLTRQVKGHDESWYVMAGWAGTDSDGLMCSLGEKLTDTEVDEMIREADIDGKTLSSDMLGVSWC